MRYQDALGDDLTRGYARLLARRRRRLQRVRIFALASVGALFFAAVGFGALHALGWPAPDSVRADLAAVDQGIPADLALNPDVVHAKAVASAGDATMYAAALRGGGFCTEMVTAGDRARGAVCSAANARPIEVSAATDTEGDPRSPIVLGGRVTARAATSISISYNGSTRTDEVTLADGGFFILQVPIDRLEAAHAGEIDLVAHDKKGREVGTAVIPADFDDSPVSDESQPLYVSTRSDSSDFTKVHGIEGFVGDPSAVVLELRYRDGDHVRISINPDRSFSYTVPIEREDSFMTPQTLVSLDADGHVLVTRSVAAVAQSRKASG